MSRMIRHSRALEHLSTGTVIYNTASFDLGAQKTYFIKGANEMFQPCDEEGKVHLLKSFEEGFASDQIFLPVWTLEVKHG